MLELSQAGVLFLDREHKLMGEASAAAPELLGHTCGAGTAFVQVIADLVDVTVRRETVAYLESMWQAEAFGGGRRHAESAGSACIPARATWRIRFSRLVVDGRVHHIIVSIERISAPRIVPHTIEVPALDEDTFAKRLAGETGTRPALNVARSTPPRAREPGSRSVQPPAVVHRAATDPCASPPSPCRATRTDLPPMRPAVRLGPLDVTATRLPSARPTWRRSGDSRPAATAQLEARCLREDSDAPALAAPIDRAGCVRARSARHASSRRRDHLATTITSPDAMSEAAAERPAAPLDPSAIIDPPDPRLNEVLREVMHDRCRAARDVPGRSAREGRPAARHHQTARARAAGLPRKAGADPRADPRHPRARRAAAVAVGVRTRRALRGSARTACATSRPCRATISCRWR